jgi:protein-disulfide isomerase
MIFNNYNNAEAVIVKLLKNLGINIPFHLVIAELDKHPDNNNLLGISDVLNNFQINNAGYKVAIEDLLSIPCPFITHTDINGGDFLLVSKIYADGFLVSSQKWNNHKLSINEFKKVFKGAVLTAEVSYSRARKLPVTNVITRYKGHALIVGVTLVFLASLIYHSNYFERLSWQILLLTVFKTAGLITSILLLVQSIDTNNPLVNKLCQSGEKTNCNAILSSNAAKVFEWLNWSEVGFFYFAGSWLLLLFGSGTLTVLTILAALNLVSLPYTIYSINYQARIAKQWCVLCCTVQGLLWLEFIPLFTYLKNITGLLSTGIDLNTLSTVAIFLLVPVIAWKLLKPLFLAIQQKKTLKNQLHNFKYNINLFNKLLTEQPKYTNPDEEWSIVLGNVEADNVLTIVSNPYCQPCSKAHKEIEDWLAFNPNLQVRIVFTSANLENDRNTIISRHLMALNNLPDKNLVKKAMHDWYEQKQKNYEGWNKAYPVQLNEMEYNKIDKQKAWCKLAEITATPTLLLNGYRLPDLYQIPDLKYMLY